jgi:hypothetical protein
MKLQISPQRNPAERSARDSEELLLANPKDVFIELFELLEDYGPKWYTEEQHNRAVEALRVLQGS